MAANFDYERSVPCIEGAEGQVAQLRATLNELGFEVNESNDSVLIAFGLGPSGWRDHPLMGVGCLAMAVSDGVACIKAN